MQSFFQLTTNFKPSGHQPEAIKNLLTALNKDEQDLTLLGVTGSGKTFTIANVIAKSNKPTLIMAPNKTLAAQLYGEMKEFFPNNAVEYFVSYYDYYQPEAYVPATDTYIEKDSSINELIDRMRLSATKALLQRRDTIIIASVSAIYGLGDPESYLEMVLHLDKGDLIDQRVLLKKLSQLQYKRNDTEFCRANYRVRGDVIDIYPADVENEALRIELFGNEIERLRIFDPLTGRIFKEVPRYTVFPRSHYVTSRDKLLNAIESIKLDLKDRLNELENDNNLLAAQRLSQRTQYDIEMIVELGYCSGIENYSRYLSNRAPGAAPPTLLEYLPDDALLIIDESHVTVPQIGAMYKGDKSRKQNLVNYGFRLPSALDNRPLQFKEFEKLKKQTIYVSATPGPYELSKSITIVEQIVRPTGLLEPLITIKPAQEQVDDILSEIRKRVPLKQRVLITTLTKKMAEDLSKYLLEQQIKVRYLHSDINTLERMEIIRDLRLGTFDVLVGINLLREGLDIPEVSLIAILDADKEGFLRSERSLIQTMGRAARNINGKVILYADKVTKSMEAAIATTKKRRKIQESFNKKHNIQPRTVNKNIDDLFVSAYGKDINDTKEVITEELSTTNLLEKITSLEKKMYDHAENLEFEQAAKLREEVVKLQYLLKKS